MRSGKYKQAKRQLRRGVGGDLRMCCLGVLCDVFRKETKRGKWLRSKPDDWLFKANGHADASALPPSVIKWAGLSDNNPDIRLSARESSAAGLNDEGNDFNFIADMIEKYL